MQLRCEAPLGRRSCAGVSIPFLLAHDDAIAFVRHQPKILSHPLRFNVYRQFVGYIFQKGPLQSQALR